MRRRSAAPLLIAPLALGAGAVALVVFGGDAFSTGELLAAVTAAFVLLVLSLGSVVPRWLRERCPSCPTRS